MSQITEKSTIPALTGARHVGTAFQLTHLIINKPSPSSNVPRYSVLTLYCKRSKHPTHIWATMQFCIVFTHQSSFHLKTLLLLHVVLSALFFFFFCKNLMS